MPSATTTSDPSPPPGTGSPAIDASATGGGASSSSSQLLMFGAADSPARTSRLLENARAWLESVPVSGLPSAALLDSFDRQLWSSRTSPGFYRVTEARTLPKSFEGWRGSGMMSRGAAWTLNTAGWHSAASVCSLSAVLVPPALVPRKYFLSPKACAGILRRAAARKKMLPDRLRLALQRVADLARTFRLGGAAASRSQSLKPVPEPENQPTMSALELE